MIRNPIISIIVPVYNSEQYLQKCLESLLSQTLQEIEIICINDGSQDSSKFILQRIKDERIVIIDKKNKGVSDSRNCGLRVANGKYIMFVDSDDWLESETCEVAYDAIMHENADIVMWSYITETPKRSSPKHIFDSKCSFDEFQIKNTIQRRFIGLIGEELTHPELADALCPVWGKLYKKSLIELTNVQFTDLKEIGTYEDGLFNLVVFGAAQKVVYIPDCFYHYLRLNVSSVTSGYRERLFSQWQNLFRIMEKYIIENEFPEIYMEALSNRIALSILGLGLNIMQSSGSPIQKMKEIKEILVKDNYRNSYKNLRFEYFPIHWKIFYTASKLRFSSVVYLLLMIINKRIQ